MKYILVLLCVLPLLGMCQSMVETEDSIQRPDIKIFGTLSIPNDVKGKIPLLILISGSGPTDRNCNSGMGFKSEAFSKLAKAMAEKNIAVFRYDKRGIGKSIAEAMKEERVRFDEMVDDCKAVLQHFKQDNRFGSITLAGHSEGSLVGMLSVDETCRFVSIAGVADNAGDVIKTQLKGQFSQEKETQCYTMLDSLKQGHTVPCSDPQLMMLFRASVQPYLISWFKYTPSQIIAKLKIPVLIINGSNDIQVGVDQAEKLHKANINSKLVVVPDMNHVLIETKAKTNMENMMTYNQPELPLAQPLINELALFVSKK